MEIKARVNKTLFSASMSFMELLFHSVVRDARKSSGNATLGLLIVMAQSLMMLAFFFLLFTVLGMRSVAIRGDFVIFLLTGIFLFLTHNKAVKSAMGAVSPVGGLTLHTPINSLLNIMASVLSGLYLQVLGFALILLVVHILRGGLDFYNPAGLIFPFFMAWASGIAIGLIFGVLTPFAPKFMPMVSMMYRRANMITSGKMLPANYMSATMITWFDWNPLFHSIDQARGHAFVNYFPHHTNMEYPVYLSLTLVMIAMMIEFWLRKNMSQSWGKRSML
jgi:ABC-type polysaccharide/polyol phosphate export permease